MEQRRRQRRRRAIAIGAILLIAGGVAIAVAGVGDDLVASVRSVFEGPADDPPAGSEPEDAIDHLDAEVQLTAAVLVLPSVDDPADIGDEPGAGLQSVVVLADAAGTSTGTIALLPPSLTVDLGEDGSMTLAEAYRDQGSPMVLRAATALLGLDLDGGATITPAGWEALGGETDGIEVDVRRPIEGATTSGQVVRFDAGEQRLEGRELRRYLTLDVPGTSQLDVLPRTQVVLDAVIAAVDGDPATSERALEAAVERFDGDLDLPALHALLGRLAADGEEPPTTLTVPVQATGGEDDPEGYRLDEDRVIPLLDRLAAWEDATQATGRRLRVLNGNGVPGIGPRIGTQLEEAGFRALLTGNADRFTYEQTRILIHGDDDEVRAAAREVQDVLGTGTIERSGELDAPIDLTIVVGQDLAPGSDDRT